MKLQNYHCPHFSPLSISISLLLSATLASINYLAVTSPPLAIPLSLNTINPATYNLRVSPFRCVFNSCRPLSPNTTDSYYQPFSSITPHKTHTYIHTHTTDALLKEFLIYVQVEWNWCVTVCMGMIDMGVQKLIFTLYPLLQLVTFNWSHSFKKRSQSLITFFRIWNSGQLFENRLKLWPQLWSFL